MDILLEERFRLREQQVQRSRSRHGVVRSPGSTDSIPESSNVKGTFWGCAVRGSRKTGGGRLGQSKAEESSGHGLGMTAAECASFLLTVWTQSLL